MTDQIRRHLEALSQKDLPARREAMVKILEEEGFPYITQEAPSSFKNPQGVINYLFSVGDAPGLLFCAHYDAVAGSSGANDNAASVCILIDLARELKDKQISAHFAFFDAEECRQAGSRLYASSMDRNRITGVVNLDMCGYGDTLVVCGKGHEKKAPVKAFCQKEILEKYNGQLLRYLPKSDDASFSGSRLPVLSMAVVPYWDIQYLKALATYGGGFLGRPPEYDMMLGQMEVSATMHGGSKDAPEFVQTEAMDKVYHYLLDAVLAPQEQSQSGSGFAGSGLGSGLSRLFRS